jgi:fucose 4-O-acetylase-like acetyltransferase
MDITLNKSKKRIDYIDMAKGFAIICVILGHAGLPIAGCIVYTFHMPLFFIISGMLFKDSPNVIMKRCKKYLKPYFFTLLILMIFDLLYYFTLNLIHDIPFKPFSVIMDYIIGAFYGSAGRNDFFYFRPFMIGAMWFFLALLWGLLFLHLIIKIKHI